MVAQQFFATCPRGLEAVLEEELKGVGAQSLRPTDGGVGFSGDMTLCYRANLESRVATRILWRVGQGKYRSEDDLYQAAMALDWPKWFKVERSFMVKVTGIKCPLKSLEFITLRIKDAVCDKFREAGGSRPDIDTRQPDVRIHAFLTADGYQFYLDTSGNALYQRGQRRASVEAPLRENLAAGILKLSGWVPGTPLLDPMCGSGTFLLEAAMMALDIAPGSGRTFGFEKLENFDADLAAMRKLPRLEPSRSLWKSGSDATCVPCACQTEPGTGRPARSGLLTQKDITQIEPTETGSLTSTRGIMNRENWRHPFCRGVGSFWLEHLVPDFRTCVCPN